MKILFLGKPGSGKGTYAEMISKEFKIPKLAMGDLLRAEIKERTEEGKIIADYINKGKLAPEEIVRKLINKELERKKDFILDGFPRNLDQAESLKVELDKVFYLNCSDTEIMRRLINRRTCIKCNKIFNLLTNPPKKQGVCDDCGSKLMKRSDETKNAVKQRLEIFKKETEPLVEYYKKKGNLIEVDGNPPIEIVYKEIKSYLK